MTQEEKAKRYDEVFNVAKEWYNNPNSSSIGKSYLYAVFPELKESEDEKILRHLKAVVKEYDMWTERGLSMNDVLAWLEKQGGQKPVDKVEPKFKVKYAGNEYNVFEVKDIAGVTYYGIEDEPNHIDYVLPDNCEIVSEQKLADKVEPKFKEGQWIVWQGKYYKINYNGCGYELVDQNGLNTSLEYGTIDENAHLWTIEDAKAGDILYTPKGLGVEGIFLVSGWQQIEGTGKTLCSYIGYRVDDDEIVEGGLGAIWWKGVKDPFFPATKEQREPLFHKMKEAGYEWDVDKKELKKIKDEIEIQFGAKDSELQEDTYYIPKGFHAEIDDDKVVIKNGEKPTEWSEKYIADVFEKVGLAKIVREQSNDALTIALQDAMIELSKVTLQPKPTAWSEEDEGIFDEIIDFLENGTVKLQHDLSLYASWLKSLKDRYAWRASWEQLDALEYHLKHTNENSRLYKETKKLYDQLKRL